MRLIDADNYIGKVIASHCYSGVNKVIRIDDVPTVDVNNLIIEELENIKTEIKEEQKRILTLDNGQYYVALCDFQKLLDKHVEELS